MVMNSNQYRAVTTPILNSFAKVSYDQRTDEYKPVFYTRPGIDKQYEELVLDYGFPAAPLVEQGNPIDYAEGGILNTPRIYFNKYGLAFAMTEELIDDGEDRAVGKRFAEHLGRSIAETEEVIPTNILNRGFNTSYIMPGGDGVPLFSASHPAGVGASLSNLSTSAALSPTSVEQMIIDSNLAKNAANLPINLIQDQLVVPPALEQQAWVILNTVQRVSTANNDLNPLKGMGRLPGGIKKITRLSSSTAWFMTMKNVQEGLLFLTRGGVNKKMEGDFETGNMRYKGTVRFGCGWGDWRRAWGNVGV